VAVFGGGFKSASTIWFAKENKMGEKNIGMMEYRARKC
jgi:hypothetical protein